MSGISGFDKATLANLGNGTMEALFQKKMGEVMANIEDPNRSATTVREIVLKIKIKPTAERTFGNVELSATTKLAGHEAVASAIHFGHDGRGLKAYTPKNVQGELFPTDDIPAIGKAAAANQGGED